MSDKDNDQDAFTPAYSDDLSEHENLPALTLNSEQFEVAAKQLTKGGTPEQWEAMLSHFAGLCPETVGRFGATVSDSKLAKMLKELPAVFQLHGMDGSKTSAPVPLMVDWQHFFFTRRDLVARLLMSGGANEVEARLWAMVIVIGQTDALLRKMDGLMSDAFNRIQDETLGDGITVFQTLTGGHIDGDIIDAMRGPSH